MIPMLPQISQSAGMRRDNICICVSPSNRARLAALIGDRNTPSKVVWRAEIVLATADGTARHQRDHAAHGQIEAVRLALAGALYRGGRRGADARQDPSFAQAAAS